MKPERIQRKRTNGWRMPPNSKYVGRPTKWGNPFKVGDLLGTVPGPVVRKAGYWLESAETYISAEIAIDLFRAWVKDQMYHTLPELAKYNYLACWCPLDQPCHVDVLIELLEEW